MMGMSSYIVGFRPADDEWNRMKMIWDSCKEADIDPPTEVEDFFDGEDPGDKPGVEINIDEAVKEWTNNDYASGYEVEISKLPKGLKVLRFINSW